MGLIVTTGGLLCAVAIAAVSRLLADEAKAWMPRLTEWLVQVAVGHLPADQRERYGEEWRGHICELPGELARLITAVGYLLAAGRIRTIIIPPETTWAQRVADGVFATAMLFVLLPMFGWVALAIKLDGLGPVFIRRRLRRSNDLARPVLVFQTRRVCPKTGAMILTQVGSFLGRYEIDELPVYFDILWGRAPFKTIHRWWR